MADLLEKQVGEYRLIRFLGNGSFGVVYEGVHIHLETHAAVKLLKGSFTEVEIKEFLNEARILARLEHPNIVRIFTFNVAILDEQKIPFLAMSLAPNGTLLKRHPHGTSLPLLTVITYVKQIASALQYAHNNKYIHRDVKPENILLGKNDELLLSDFGIAVVAHSTHSQETQKPIGSWAYAAPEQFVGKAVPASDQYSLAVAAYEWLCGERPFHGDFTQLAMQHHLNILPPPLHEKMNISPAVEQVVMKALEKNPKNRFATIQAFALALENALVSHIPATIPAKPTTPIPPAQGNFPGGFVQPGAPYSFRAVLSSPPPSPRPSPPQPQPSPRRTYTIWFKVVATLLGIALMVGGIFTIPWSHLFNPYPYPYPSYMVGHGTLVDQDPLGKPAGWSFSDLNNCLVENDALHILAANGAHTCEGFSYLNDNVTFALETQVTYSNVPGMSGVDTSTYCGGIDIYTYQDGMNHEFEICSNSTYIVQGENPQAIHLKSLNKGILGTLGAVVSSSEGAVSSDLFFYVNQRQVADLVIDDSGGAGSNFYVDPQTPSNASTKEVNFSNLRIWN